MTHRYPFKIQTFAHPCFKLDFQNDRVFDGCEYYWRAVAKNGETVFDGSEAYVSRSNVRRAVRRWFGPDVEIEVVDD